jgi:hypothetical protein
MKLFVLMPDVRECVVTDCAFNQGRACHARAVTIGDGIHPACDTYHPNVEKRASARTRAGIGACKVDRCEWNEDLACHARSVRDAHHQGHADCVTFSPRSAPT